MIIMKREWKTPSIHAYIFFFIATSTNARGVALVTPLWYHEDVATQLKQCTVHVVILLWRRAKL